MEGLEYHVTEIMKQITERTRVHFSGPLAAQLQSAVNDLLSGQARIMAGVMEFRDSVVIELRALCLVLEMSLSASTHAEKNARLRGAIELIGATVSRLNQEQFEFSYSHWHMNGGFTRDGVTSRLFQENRDLRRRIEEMEAERNTATTDSAAH